MYSSIMVVLEIAKPRLENLDSEKRSSFLAYS